MPLLKEIKYDSSIGCYCDIVIEKEEFTKFSTKVQNQVLSTVKVDGFRPGKAPASKAMAQIDPNHLIQTIIQETIKRYLPESVDLLSKEIKEKEKKHALEYEASLSDDSLGIRDDGTFIFRLNVKLLPDIDLEVLKKAKVPKLDDKDIPVRISLEEFEKQEKAKLIDNLNTQIEKNGGEKTDDLQEALDLVPEAKKVFENEEKFKENLKSVYEYETEYIKANARQRKYIDLILADIEDFDIPSSTIDPEVERITTNMKEDSQKANVTLKELFEQSGIPNYDEIEIKEEEDLRKVLRKYIYNEYKLMFTLRAVYELETPTKLENKRIEEVANEMSKNPDTYRVPSNLETRVYHNLAFDRLMRATAIETINGWATKNSTSKTVESKVSKEKIEAKDKKDS